MKERHWNWQPGMGGLAKHKGNSGWGGGGSRQSLDEQQQGEGDLPHGLDLCKAGMFLLKGRSSQTKGGTDLEWPL